MDTPWLGQIKTSYRINNNVIEFILTDVPVDVSIMNILNNDNIKKKIYNDISFIFECELIKISTLSLDDIKFKFIIEYDIASVDNDIKESDNLISAIINKIEISIEERKLKSELQKISNENDGIIVPGLIPESK
jgi:DNA repair exonuclease SbcCD nuclease subunit